MLRQYPQWQVFVQDLPCDHHVDLLQIKARRRKAFSALLQMGVAEIEFEEAAELLVERSDR